MFRKLKTFAVVGLRITRKAGKKVAGGEVIVVRLGNPNGRCVTDV